MLRYCGPYTFEQSRRQISLEGCRRTRGRRLVAGHCELLAVLGVVRPATFDAQALTNSDARQMPRDSNELLLSRDLEPGYAVAILLIEVANLVHYPIKRLQLPRF